MVRRPSAPPAILFDLDRTLFDHHHGLQAGLRALRSDHASLRDVTLKELEEEYDLLLTATHQGVLDGRVTQGDARADRIRRLFEARGETIPMTEARRRARRYREAYVARERAVPGAPELLHRLRRQGHRLAVVTNNPLAGQWEKLRFGGMSDAVQILVASGPLGYSKPDPRIFHVALRRLGAPAQGAVMVGDSFESDVKGAWAAGLVPVWFNPEGERAPGGAKVRQLRSWRPTGVAVRTLREAAGLPG